MNHDHLEDWAIRAGQELQDMLDYAIEAEGMDNPNTMLSTRVLLRELDDIVAGRPPWHSQVRDMESQRNLLDDL